MKKAWSLSTTVRNPDRILPFLITLSEMEGDSFDEDGQVKYQTLLIKNKLYRPTGLDAKQLTYYENSDESMDMSHAKSIFEHMVARSRELQKDPGLRGRTSAAPLTKMGLATATKTGGAVQITSLGRAFMDGSLDIGEIYFRFFLKWQIPTPGSKDFRDSSIYDIKPFIGSIHLIDAVNKLAEAEGLPVKGLSKDEFQLFAQTLISTNDIAKWSQSIIELRKSSAGKSKLEQRKIFNSYATRFVGNFLETQDSSKIEALISTVHDYADNSIRYFRLTRYLYIRGNGYYIDLEPRRSTEIDEILKMSAASQQFSSEVEYIKFLTDSSLPILPWQTHEKLTQIIKLISDEIASYEDRLKLGHTPSPIDLDSLDIEALKGMVVALRAQRRSLQERLNHEQASSEESLIIYINKLKDIFKLEEKPIQLEKYASLGLHALNDAIAINPNYPVGDDNEPTFTAPANVPDIECFYESANSICEVTMLTSRDQWYNEGQPVMRHLRDFETRYPDKPTYCIFIAPSLHRDTVNTFWTSTKYEYEGTKQRIIPLRISDFIKILQTLSDLRLHDRSINHVQLLGLYDQIVDLTSSVASSDEWLAGIPAEINKWKLSL